MLDARLPQVTEERGIPMFVVDEDAIEPPSGHNPKVPRTLDAIVTKALPRGKAKRCQGASEMVGELRGLKG